MDNSTEVLLSNINWNDLLKDIRWTSYCPIIKRRDNYRCTICGSTANLLVHHKQYHYLIRLRKLKYPWDYPPEVLTTVCTPCHDKGHLLYNIPVIYI